MNLKQVLALGMGLGAGLAPLSGVAATATTTFNVTATVIKNCKVSATNLAFGNYDSLATANTTGQSTVTVNCTKNAGFTVALDVGTNGGGSFTTRAMKETGGAGNTLGYQLYTDSALSTVWGDGTNSTSTDSGTGAGPGTGNAQVFTVYGSVPAAQNVEAGSYSDTVNVTVNY